MVRTKAAILPSLHKNQKREKKKEKLVLQGWWVRKGEPRFLKHHRPAERVTDK